MAAEEAVSDNIVNHCVTSNDCNDTTDDWDTDDDDDDDDDFGSTTASGCCNMLNIICSHFVVVW